MIHVCDIKKKFEFSLKTNPPYTIAVYDYVERRHNFFFPISEAHIRSYLFLCLFFPVLCFIIIVCAAVHFGFCLPTLA